jgi:hypothetical protein
MGSRSGAQAGLHVATVSSTSQHGVRQAVVKILACSGGTRTTCTQYSVKRELLQCQKRPTTVSKEHLAYVLLAVAKGYVDGM